jgi:hypothetical protein
MRAMENEDMLYIVSDHGNDPTFEGTSHTREYVPLMVYSRMFRPRRQANLGIRASLADVAETIADSYDLNVRFAATSFLGEHDISALRAARQNAANFLSVKKKICQICVFPRGPRISIENC